MLWWFLILGLSTLVVVCVAIAIYLHLRRSLQRAHASHDKTQGESEHETDGIEH